MLTALSSDGACVVRATLAQLNRFNNSACKQRSMQLTEKTESTELRRSMLCDARDITEACKRAPSLLAEAGFLASGRRLCLRRMRCLSASGLGKLGLTLSQVL